MSFVVQTFFLADKRSLADGIMINSNGASIMVKAVLGGFLADEKALKEIFDWKGACGILGC